MKFDFNNLLKRVTKSKYFQGGMLLLLIHVVQFSPAYLHDKAFLSGDAVSAANATAPLKQSWAETGDYPFWQPYVFSGMPAYESLTFTRGVYLPGEALTLIRDVLHLPLLFPQLFHLYLAGLFTFIFLKRRGLSQTASLLGGAVFMMNPYIVTMLVHGHGSQSSTTAYIPLVFLTVSELLDRPGLMKAVLVALVAGFQLQRAHVQIIYYTWMLVGLYALYCLVSDIRSKRAAKELALKYGLLVGALAVAFSLAAVLYLPVKEYTAFSIRGGGDAGGTGLDYAMQWSFSPGEIMTFFIPSFYGFGGASYWGSMPFTDYPNYMGILALSLAVYALVRRNDKLVVFLALAFVLALVVSFGRHFSLLYSALYSALPYFNKFRVPAMILVLVQFSVAVMAGYGLQALVSDTGKKQVKKKKEKTQSPAERYILYAVGAVAAVMALMALFAGSLESSFMSITRAPGGLSGDKLAGLNAERFDLFFRDFWIVSGIVLAFLIAAWYRAWSSANAALITVTAIVLTVVDVGRVDSKIINSVGYQPASLLNASGFRTGVTDYLNQDEDYFRIFPTTPQFFRSKVFASQGIESIGGYHPAKLKLYQSFIEQMPFGSNFVLGIFYQKVRNMQWSERKITDYERTRLAPYLDILSMLNVKYIVSPGELKEPSFRMEKKFRSDQTSIRRNLILYKNLNVLPRAWLVNRYNLLPDEAAVLKTIQMPGFDPARLAYISNAAAAGELDSSAAGTVLITEKSNGRIALDVETTGRMLLVLSEVYYPAGWSASLDGEPVDLVQTNYILTSLIVPKGNHTVVFEYQPPGFSAGLSLTLAGWAALAAAFIFTRYSRRRKNKTGD